MNKKSDTTRQHILQIGYQLALTKGFVRVGLTELLRSANVPKGSFYYYFASKEKFGEALIDYYFQRYLQKIDDMLCTATDTYYQRLINYFTYLTEVENGMCNANRCLVVKLSAEVADLSEAMRLALRQGTDKVISAIADCIAAGQQQGSIRAGDSRLLAEHLHHLWIGASLLNKLYLNQLGLQDNLLITKTLLKP